MVNGRHSHLSPVNDHVRRAAVFLTCFFFHQMVWKNSIKEQKMKYAVISSVLVTYHKGVLAKLLFNSYHRLVKQTKTCFFTSFLSKIT